MKNIIKKIMECIIGFIVPCIFSLFILGCGIFTGKFLYYLTSLHLTIIEKMLSIIIATTIMLCGSGLCFIVALYMEKILNRLFGDE